jgi:hypothetical protein
LGFFCFLFFLFFIFFKNKKKDKKGCAHCKTLGAAVSGHPLGAATRVPGGAASANPAPALP